ncbi:hypothetical protein MJO29_001727 [Puccinia striiformis f. sp. tritici]|uniref:alpha,alpha-trehalase n=1 Tax=Puccinia striiformis f. sp. tritici PST-78 TaxID=1165861 RepID=A0A0L0W4P4_9BASI|nr:hypothetical protein Pst134EA_003071 [Puccinia striiformis f. sp. tritici]KAH9472459.1 hypothetical protein Pst134EA_003071 [Puccinia striiformis f. sp. tritici]KAI7965979.1 hypothetical protein MJO29_001727 [Puccinia striiformis f. sp. tritici]KNF06481.1 hypothetical protein PSTG_00358 [Puccinia striiformis f. sp. tritici PST-78]KNF06482.1 hypothetical protein, variant [Puccinia striiformis f. sp. tritici PST-78]
MTILAHFVLFWLGIALPAWSTSHQNSTDSSYPTRFRGVRWDNEQWKLVNTVLEPGRYQSRISLANGYLGINLAALGPFFEKDHPENNSLNGWPVFDRRQSFATIAGFYDYQLKLNSSNFPWLNQYGGESIISGIPHWAGLLVKTKSAILDASTDPTQIRNFQSSLDLKAGLMRWKFDWVLDGVQPMISIEYTMFVNKLHINRAAVQLKVKAAGDIELRVVDLLDGECAVRTDLVEKHHHSNSSTICSTVSPDGMAHLTGHVCSSLRSKAFSRSELFEGLPQLTDHSTSTIAQSASLKLKREQSVVVEKFIGAASGDAFSNPQAIALQSALAGADDGFAAQLDSHRKEWSSIMTEDSVDDYGLPEQGPSRIDPDIVELQILAITNPFHLLQNTLSSNAIALSDNSTALDNWSISVCGLGSSCYGGMIFWDAEVWMAPGLVLSHPQAAQRIINYRVAQFPQAQENLKMAYSSSQNQTNQFSPGDAIYPWTSGRFGNCTASGPCFDYEYHINGDIGLSFYHHLVATGNFNSFKRNLLPIYQAIAGLFSNLLSETSDWKYGLRNATDPDEYANHVNNPAYTMFLMKHHLITANELGNIFGQKTNPIWSKQAENLALPIDNQTGIILEYEGMNSSIEVKQADVVLIDDFLNFPNPHRLENLEYYGTKQSLNGPGMTYGVYSVVENRFQVSGCSSYTYQLLSSQPYVRAPWFQFSEQLVDDYSQNGGTHPAFPFLTGMGGDYRVTVYGYLGLRLELDHLSIEPSLPPQIASLRYRKFYWHGYPVRAKSNQTHTTLFRPRLGAIPDADPDYADAPIPVKLRSSTRTLKLKPQHTLTVPNRAVYMSNPLQCAPIKSDQAFHPGQFPISIADGSSATRWVPSDLPATITVQLNEHFRAKSIIGFGFQSSNFTEFRISFFDDPAQTVGAIESTYSSLNGSQLGFYPFVGSDDNVGAQNSSSPEDRGWRFFKLEQAIAFRNYANLTVFEPPHSDSLNVERAVHTNQHISNSNSRLLGVAEWTVLTSHDHSSSKTPGIIQSEVGL